MIMKDKKLKMISVDFSNNFMEHLEQKQHDFSP